MSAERGAAWWSSGWQLFVVAPGTWICMTLLLVAVMFLLNWIPVIGQLASTVLYPALSGGLVLAARAADRGEPVRLTHLFSCFDHRHLWPLVAAALLYIAGWFVVWLCAIGVGFALLDSATLETLLRARPSEFDFSLLLTMGRLMMVVVLVFVVLGTPLIMAYWFVAPLILLRGDRPVEAMRSSFRASLRNMPPFLVYSVLGMVFAIGATLAFGLGWIVLVPVFGATVYTSYTDIFGDQGPVNS